LEEQEMIAKETAEAIFQSAEDRVKANGQLYWQKIATFQVELNGKSWQIVEEYDTGGHGNYEACELCGFPNCRFKFVIADPKTNERLSIGDECILNYVKDLNAKEILSKYRKKVTIRLYAFKRCEKWYTKIAKYNQDHPGTRTMFLESIAGQLLKGYALSKRQIAAVEQVLGGQAMGTDLPAQTQAMRAQYEQLFEAIKPHFRHLSAWEREFVQSTDEQVKRGRILSEKQLAILKDLPARYTNIDEETIRRLTYTLNSGLFIFGPVRDILVDMQRRHQVTFSDKQKALIEKNYQRAMTKFHPQEVEAEQQ
jgi:hypothetical protein